MGIKNNIRLPFLVISVNIALLACSANVSAEVPTAQQEILNITPNMYKQDYLQACKLISNEYIYLEQQLGITREQFYEQNVAYGESVD